EGAQGERRRTHGAGQHAPPRGVGGWAPYDFIGTDRRHGSDAGGAPAGGRRVGSGALRLALSPAQARRTQGEGESEEEASDGKGSQHGVQCLGDQRAGNRTGRKGGGQKAESSPPPAFSGRVGGQRADGRKEQPEPESV